MASTLYGRRHLDKKEQAEWNWIRNFKCNICVGLTACVD